MCSVAGECCGSFGCIPLVEERYIGYPVEADFDAFEEFLEEYEWELWDKEVFQSKPKFLYRPRFSR